MPELRALPHDPAQVTLWGRSTQHPYLADEALFAAANVAISLGLPLLLTGEPGCGKTDFAFALARYQSGQGEAWDPDDPVVGILDSYVRSDTRARDLLYHYDAVRRFGDAQHGDPKKVRDPRHYVELRPLGRALAQAGAGVRRVVLIDEIDKAPRDLPNDLLRELEQGRFEIKELDDVAPEAPVVDSHGIPLARALGLRRPEPEQRPLVIITSNEERQLPDAFLRRCVFHHIAFPDKARLEGILARRKKLPRPSPEQQAAVKTFMALRNAEALRKPPSTAELITWWDALDQQLFGPGAHAAVARYAAMVEKDKRQRWVKPKGRPHWGELDGKGCLLKLRHDWERVARV